MKGASPSREAPFIVPQVLVDFANAAMAIPSTSVIELTKLLLKSVNYIKLSVLFLLVYLL